MARAISRSLRQDLGAALNCELSRHLSLIARGNAGEACRDKPRTGDILRVTMNHVCPVNNLFDKVVFVRGADVLGAVTVNARGKVQ